MYRFKADEAINFIRKNESAKTDQISSQCYSVLNQLDNKWELNVSISGEKHYIELNC